MLAQRPLLSLLCKQCSVSLPDTPELIQGHVLLWHLASCREHVNTPSNAVDTVTSGHILPVTVPRDRGSK
jgi:hypothetical protein